MEYTFIPKRFHPVAASLSSKKSEVEEGGGGNKPRRSGVPTHNSPSRSSPQREKKSETGGRGKKKSREILGPTPFGVPTLRGPFFQVRAPPFRAHDTHQIQKWIGPNGDWPKLAKSGWPKRDWPKSVSSGVGEGGGGGGLASADA